MKNLMFDKEEYSISSAISMEVWRLHLIGYKASDCAWNIFNCEDYTIEKVVACFHGAINRESVMAGQRSIFFIVRDHLSTQLRIENGYEINKHNSS